MRAKLQPVGKSIGVIGAPSIIFASIFKAAHKRPIRRLSFKPGTKNHQHRRLDKPAHGQLHVR